MIYRRDRTSNPRQKLASTEDPPAILLIVQACTWLDVIRADQGRAPFTQTLQGRGRGGWRLHPAYFWWAGRLICAAQRLGRGRSSRQTRRLFVIAVHAASTENDSLQLLREVGRLGEATEGGALGRDFPPARRAVNPPTTLPHHRPSLRIGRLNAPLNSLHPHIKTHTLSQRETCAVFIELIIAHDENSLQTLMY